MARKKNYLSLDLSLYIDSKYSCPPTTREDQINFIKDVKNYNGLRGAPDLKYANDRQLRAVSIRLHGEAQEVIEMTMKEATKRPSLAEVVERDYKNHLYEIFNIPTEHRENVNPSNLEAELLK